MSASALVMRVRLRVLVLCAAAAFCTLCLFRTLHLSSEQAAKVSEDAAWQERAPRSLSYGGSRDYESVSTGGLLLPHDYDNNINEFQLPLDTEVTPSARLLTSLGDIFISIKTSSNYHKSRLDVILKTWFTLAREEDFQCHKLILSLSSEMFKTMFSSNFKEAKMSPDELIVLKNVEPEVFAFVLRYMYGDDMENINDASFGVEVYKLAHELNMVSLIKELDIFFKGAKKASEAFAIFDLYLRLDGDQMTLNFCKETWLFTDSQDAEYQEKTNGHLINTNCSSSHNRKALCCKMSVEFDTFLRSDKKWFCHFDDDNYVNIPKLLSTLGKYSPQEDWYLGKPSIRTPLEILDREKKKYAAKRETIKFWFATGGAGFCISRALALKMSPAASGGKFISVCEKIRLPDDVTIGYIIEHLLKKKLTFSPEFHSHLEPMKFLLQKNFPEQITFSYSGQGKEQNVLKVEGLDLRTDPTRFLSLHCYLFPHYSFCPR